jgi:primosomal protein N' (replication factor Y)
VAAYADIALPVGVDRPFTYLLPADLEALAAVGCRVVVPFGRKLAVGIVVGLPTRTEIPHLKPVREILDPSPIVSPELLRLSHWVADYYMAPIGEVLKAANPGAFARPSKKLVTLSPFLTPELEEQAIARSKKRSLLIRLLRERGPLPSSVLEKETGLKNIGVVLNVLEHSGVLSSEEVLSLPKSAIRTREFIDLASVDRRAVREFLTELPPRSAKTRAFLEMLLALSGGAPTSADLPGMQKSSGIPASSVRRLKESGLFTTARREIRPDQDFSPEEETLRLKLNSQQESVRSAIVEALLAGIHRTFLLHGVTGSGKTQVYIECIKSALEQGKSSIVLVPEISLTPQIVRRFKSHFGDLAAVVHSRMSDPERREVWRLARKGVCRIVIGPRSAVFAPLEKIGLIVVDEEHEASYKQYDATPRYHARDVATVRGSQVSAVVLLGSATPSAESYHNAQLGKYHLLELPTRVDNVPMPEIAIVDMTAERKREYAALKASLPAEQRAVLKEYHQGSISSLLREKIEDRLSRSEGIILLQNRRGFAPFVECPECGYTESCDNCNVTMTYHSTRKHLRCHYCGAVRRPYIVCPSCGGTEAMLHGIGTQRVEEDLARLFPSARVLRMDLDTTARKGSHTRILQKFGAREADILLGTQMVAKGLDFPHVTLVGVISADTQMLLPDFRSAERTFQLLTQVAGRAGRSTLRGEVLVQTHQPRHYTLTHVVDSDFRAFYEEEMISRQELLYPPYARLVLIELKGPDEARVQKAAESFARLLRPKEGTYSLLGPAPAVVSRIQKQYRWHIILKSPKQLDGAGQLVRRSVESARAEFERAGRKDVRLIIDIDPVGLM